MDEPVNTEDRGMLNQISSDQEENSAGIVLDNFVALSWRPFHFRSSDDE